MYYVFANTPNKLEPGVFSGQRGSKMKKNDVKTNIVNALIELLDEKEYESISITDIVNKANVSRATYYRYFKEKEDVVKCFFELTKDKFISTIQVSQGGLPENNEVTILSLFLFFKANIKANKCIRKAGLEKELLNFLSTEFLSNLPVKLDEYLAYFVSGALYNVLIHWLDKDCKDPIEEVSRPFVNIQEKYNNK